MHGKKYNNQIQKANIKLGEKNVNWYHKQKVNLTNYKEFLEINEKKTIQWEKWAKILTVHRKGNTNCPSIHIKKLTYKKKIKPFSPISLAEIEVQ